MVTLASLSVATIQLRSFHVAINGATRIDCYFAITRAILWSSVPVPNPGTWRVMIDPRKALIVSGMIMRRCGWDYRS